MPKRCGRRSFQKGHGSSGLRRQLPARTTGPIMNLRLDSILRAWGNMKRVMPPYGIE